MPPAPSLWHKVRVLLIAPSLRITGGQAVQARFLLDALGKEPSISMHFQAIDPRFRGPFAALKRIKYVRTALAWAVYNVILLARIWRYDAVHVFSAGYTSYMLWTIPALFISKLYRKPFILHYHDGQGEV